MKITTHTIIILFLFAFIASCSMEVPTEEIKIVYKPECYITKPVTGNQFSIGTSIPIEIRASSKSTQNILIKLYLNCDQILSSNSTNM